MPYIPYAGKDFAVGGGQTGPTLTGNGSFDLNLQVASFGNYLSLYPDPKISRALVTVDIGANDIINAFTGGANVDTVVGQAVTNTMEDVTGLFSEGVRNLLFYTVPDLGVIPLFHGGAEQAAASDAAADFNADVLNDPTLKLLESDGLHVYVLDTFTALSNIVNDPLAHPEFTNVTTPCIDSAAALLSNCAGYLFFDDMHPTAAAHLLTAEAALSVLPVPEPSAWAMAALGFASLGLMGGFRRSRAVVSRI